jgi:DNA-binding NtrC family response regulator
MPAQIVLVHDDAAFTERVSRALMAKGFKVMVLPDPLVALDALETATNVELLITRAQFPAGRSNGQALALMGRRRRPDLKVLFLCQPDIRRYLEDLGEVLMFPVAVSKVVEAAARLVQVAADRIGVA